MNFQIHRATTADADALVAFNRAMAAESEDKALDTARLRDGVLHLLAQESDGYYLLAWAGAERAGTLMVTFEWSDWRNGRFWWIQSVYVAPQWRRRGVYRALHAYVRNAALADRQCCGLRLYVERENVGAMATYRALGMSETDYRLYEEEFTR
jgi:ribosomal protein S18 acetylase RimI-like enzyme